MYIYKGISTNNLKNISVDFKDHEIIYIGGASGSGKSSLAFDTIAAISENEYGSLTCDNKSVVKYRIQKYSAVLVAATLKQLNFNVNPRSTILTYFGLYQNMANILSHCTNLTADNFSHNGPYRCRACNGIGYIDKMDELLVVDATRTLKEGPFNCWNTSYSEFFSQLLHKFCEEQKIDESKQFGQLSKKTQEMLLYSKGTTRYKINYTVGGRKRSKTSVYIGPVLGLKSGMKDMFGLGKDKYSRLCICPACFGSRLSNEISLQKVQSNADIKFILTKSLDEVGNVINEIMLTSMSDAIGYSCESLLNFIKACSRLNISYLNFSRSISTLSGGELQRLRLAQLFLGKLKNLLVVLDEPTGSLAAHEADTVIDIIKELKKNNTVIVVDHNEKLRKIADKAYYLGPKSGIYGGQLIQEDDHNKLQPDMVTIPERKKTNKISILLKSDYVDYANGLNIYEKTLNGICGESGVGKTTILRDILPYQLERYKYITQKPIKANRNSTVASYTGLMDEIRNYYAAKTKSDKKIFSLMQDGACPQCGGKGVVLMGSFSNEQLIFDCEECGGTGYARFVLKKYADGLNIYEFLNQNIEEIIDKEISVSKKFDSTVRLLAKLGLGHLSLSRRVSSLSGGENQRIKLSEALGDNRTKIYGLDEPVKGLGRKEMFNLVGTIYESIEVFGKTFIVSEHNTEFLELCTNVSELRRQDGAVVVLKRK